MEKNIRLKKENKETMFVTKRAKNTVVNDWSGFRRSVLTMGLVGLELRGLQDGDQQPPDPAGLQGAGWGNTHTHSPALSKVICVQLAGTRHYK